MGVPYTRRNLFFEKGKLALSVTGVASALALIFLLMGFRAGLYATLTAFVDNIGADLIIAQSGVQGMFSSNSALPLDLHERAKKIVDATEAGHILVADIIFTQGETKTPVVLVGYDPTTTFGSPWKIGGGRTINSNNEVLLDTWLAQRTGLTLGDSVNLLGQKFTLVGLTLETASWMSPYIFVSLEASEGILGLSGIVSYHLLRLPKGTNPDTAAFALEAKLVGIDAMTPDDIAEADRRILANMMDAPINVMLVIGFGIGVAVMGLTAYTAVTDRMREYGVLKALGIGGARLARIVIVETFYRAGLGFVLGIILAYLAATSIMIRWPQFNVLIEIQTVVQVGILTLIMSLLSVLLPIKRINRIDPMMVFKS